MSSGSKIVPVTMATEHTGVDNGREHAPMSSGSKIVTVTMATEHTGVDNGRERAPRLS